MDNLLLHLKTLGIPDKYYENIAGVVMSDSNKYINSNNFLKRINPLLPNETTTEIKTEKEDVRIDVPVWFGDIRKSNKRVIVAGLEPRDTNNTFNVSRINEKVFASPFGANHWNFKSKIQYKPQNKYFKVLQNHLDNDELFIYLTDLVKEYKVISTEIKEDNDKYARDNFSNLSNKWKGFFKKEISIIKPNHIILFGKQTYDTALELFPEHKNILKKVRHPSHGGVAEAIKQVDLIVNNNT